MGPNLSRFLGLFRLRDASDPTRLAAVSLTGAVKTEGAGEPSLPAGGVASVQAPALISAALTVSDGQSLSAAVACGSARPVALTLPADLKGLETITAIMVSFDGGTYTALTYDDNTPLDTIDISSGESTTLPFPVYGKLFNYFKLQFGESASGALAATVALQS